MGGDGDDSFPETESIEINFRLDSDGRTTTPSETVGEDHWDNTSFVNNENEHCNNNNNNNNNYPNENNDELVDCEKSIIAVGCSSPERGVLDYRTKVVPTKLRWIKSTNRKQVQELEDQEKEKSFQELSVDPSSSIRDTCEDIWDELYYDCEIADCGFMPRTYWMNWDDEPRCSLEQFALDIFHHHVTNTRLFPSSTSTFINGKEGLAKDVNRPTTVPVGGAEWWVQIRPSPERTGRYSMMRSGSTTSSKDGKEQKGNMVDNHSNNNNKNNTTNDYDMSIQGISFHWDKDEDLRTLTGGNTYIHPHLSTVTYLTTSSIDTAAGAPTFVVNRRIHPLTGQWLMDDEHKKNQASTNNTSSDTEATQSTTTTEGFLSYPFRGKHLSFDGRFLHAAPHELSLSSLVRNANSTNCNPFVKNVDNAQQKRASSNTETNMELNEVLNDQKNNTNKTENSRDCCQKRSIRKTRRITFLVNIWLNYIPLNVHRFPDSMIDKLSGYHKKNVNNSKNQTTKEEQAISTMQPQHERIGLSFLTSHVHQGHCHNDMMNDTSTNGKSLSISTTTTTPPYRVQTVKLHSNSCAPKSITVTNLSTETYPPTSISDNPTLESSTTSSTGITSASSFTTSFTTSIIDTENNVDATSLHLFEWPMGSGPVVNNGIESQEQEEVEEEFVRAHIPVEPLISAAQTFGNVILQWTLVKDNSNKSFLHVNGDNIDINHGVDNQKQQPQQQSTDDILQKKEVCSEEPVHDYDYRDNENDNNNIGFFLLRRRCRDERSTSNCVGMNQSDESSKTHALTLAILEQTAKSLTSTAPTKNDDSGTTYNSCIVPTNATSFLTDVPVSKKQRCYNDTTSSFTTHATK